MVDDGVGTVSTAVSDEVAGVEEAVADAKLDAAADTELDADTNAPFTVDDGASIFTLESSAMNFRFRDDLGRVVLLVWGVVSKTFFDSIFFGARFF